MDRIDSFDHDWFRNNRLSAACAGIIAPQTANCARCKRSMSYLVTRSPDRLGESLSPSMRPAGRPPGQWPSPPASALFHVTQKCLAPQTLIGQNNLYAPRACNPKKPKNSISLTDCTPISLCVCRSPCSLASEPCAPRGARSNTPVKWAHRPSAQSVSAPRGASPA